MILKNIVAILILIGLLVQTLSKVVIFSGYLLNKDYITQKYCINKSKPKMHCNGKCHLYKQLKENDKQENSGKKNVEKVQDLQLFYEPFNNTKAYLNLFVSNSFSIYLEKKLDSELSSIFHPPTS